MKHVVIYHNPKCSKSRETLALLTYKGIEPEVIHYLEHPPSVTTLKLLLKQLGFKSARELMRIKDDIYKTLKLDDKNLTENALLEAMNQYPALIERPIVVVDDKAIIGRPPKNALTII